MIAALPMYDWPHLRAATDAFWADLVSQKALARKRLERPEESNLWEVGNGLLASWGRQGQALQDLLLDHASPFEEVDAFTEPPGGTLLERLQRTAGTGAPFRPLRTRLKVI